MHPQPGGMEPTTFSRHPQENRAAKEGSFAIYASFYEERGMDSTTLIDLMEGDTQIRRWLIVGQLKGELRQELEESTLQSPDQLHFHPENKQEFGTLFYTVLRQIPMGRHELKDKTLMETIAPLLILMQMRYLGKVDGLLGDLKDRQSFEHAQALLVKHCNYTPIRFIGHVPAASFTLTPLTLTQITESVASHFGDRQKYEKEVLETSAVFAFLASSEPQRVLSLACGSLVGAETFTSHFSNPQSTLTGLDIALTQTVQFLLAHNLMDSFHLEDLNATPSEAIIALFARSTRWVAIHACRDLSNRILHLFRLYAPPEAELLLIPCCLHVFSSYKAALPDDWSYFKSCFRDGTGDWRLQTTIATRNEILKREYEEGFVGMWKMEQIPSVHNTVLHFRAVEKGRDE